MATEISTATKALQARIFSEKYYQNLWVAALGKHKVSVATIDQHEESDRTLVNLCNTFWLALPDSREIRRGPFFDLCDIAEHIFDAGPDN